MTTIIVISDGVKEILSNRLVQRKVALTYIHNRIFDVLHFSYEYDPDRYEGDEQDKEVVSITKASEEASTGTVISSTNAKTGDLEGNNFNSKFQTREKLTTKR